MLTKPLSVPSAVLNVILLAVMLIYSDPNKGCELDFSLSDPIGSCDGNRCWMSLVFPLQRWFHIQLS